MELVQTRIAGGVWQGILAAPGRAEPPAIDLMHEGEILARTRLTAAGEGHWTVRATIPADALRDGVQTFVLADAATGRRLCAFTVIAGLPIGDDIRAEIALLRAEVEMLKRALRRVLRGTADPAPPDPAP